MFIGCFWGRGKENLKEALMQIEISLPEYPGGSESTESITLSWLKQLELAVHHAQKSVKEMAVMLRERDAETEDPEPMISGYLRVSGFEPDEVDGNEGSGRIEIRIYEG